jgi:hypothetical protein
MAASPGAVEHFCVFCFTIFRLIFQYDMPRRANFSSRAPAKLPCDTALRNNIRSIVSLQLELSSCDDLINYEPISQLGRFAYALPVALGVVD